MSIQRVTLILLLYIGLGITLVFYISDIPMFMRAERKNAAIAIRDNVSKFEKNGSLLFSKTCFDRKYVKSIYFTQNFHEEHKQAFIDSLNFLLKNHDEVDIYLLAHSNVYFTWLSNVDSTFRERVNLVYNTGCGNSEQSFVYKELGAKTYIGHKGRESLSPLFYFYFLRRYCVGINKEDATKQANQKVLKILKAIGRSSELEEHEGLIY